MGNGGSPPPPSFTTIDAPGAGTVSPEGTYGFGINDSGEVAGYFIDANGVAHGFVRSSTGTIMTVDALGADQTQGRGTFTLAINDSGEAAGYYEDSAEFLHSYTLSSGGTLAQFDPPNSNGSTALTINGSGVLAGAVIDANGVHGYVRSADGTFTLIDPTGNPAQVNSVYCERVNASGAIAGHYYDSNSVAHGFLRASGGAITIEDAPGAGTAAGEGTYLVDMNSSGEVVGAIGVGTVGGVDGVTHSLILSTDGTFTVFDPPAAVSSFAEGINDSGEVVGEYRDASLVRHGYLRATDGTFTSFDDPSAAQAPAPDTNFGTDPRRINASGAVTGFYSDENGVVHAFVMN